ncbi:MAG: McrB family protein [Bacillus sp. (in: firmicutes)]
MQSISNLIQDDNENGLTKETVKQFTNQLKEVFPTTLFFRLDAIEKFKDRNNNELVKVVATVMKPSQEGKYTAFPHPIKPFEEWVTSSVMRADKFHQTLHIGNIFSAMYKAQTDERHLMNIISFDLSTYTDVQMSFQELLRQMGGESLVESAESLFGSEIEQTIIQRFMTAFESYKEQIEDEQKALTKERLALEKRRKNYEERWNELNANEVKWIKLVEQSKELFQLEREEDQEETEKTVFEWNHSTIVSLLQSLLYHNADDNLIYEESVIEAFLRGIQSNILIVLSGPSGTGKSSLVQAFADAIKGAKAKFIPVQSSWTDTQDLLGYFNPVDKRFVASPFLEALADAREDSDHLHLICLDEMNLAHVEYYFSEFLSAREQKEPAIRLYSKRYYTDALSFIEQFDESEDVSGKDKERYMNALELVTRYPSMFKIPANVRFIGTLNMDHTVKPLSPKVIDRSLIIELAHPEQSGDIEKHLAEQVQKGWIDVPLETLMEKVRTNEDVEQDINEILGLARILEIIPNARLNSRGKKQLSEFLTRVGSIDAKHKDQLIYSKILPRITVSVRDEREFNKLNEFAGMIVNYPNSYKKLQKMLQGPRTVHFWC